ncbi:type II toxin-antitoxin system antitoxin DNA ADP-ribosyl glycohydrolase DarG [Nonomuraea harbinensis]|uniref:Macro domain-containing protein n=1 Tax=Nonomuraea harbinensis TaxID=1286938 RepID=A0ABW1C6Q1_9ACTN|nr:macro domain-containing protein [Nonomuraea harbinensis]
MIVDAQGDLLAAEVDALVNTVNCVGVMGKGIALQFKRRYPNMFQAYAKACRHGEVQIGRMFVVPTEQLSGPRFIINFPTKKHWRSPSRLEYIDAGLTDLKHVIREHGIKSVAIPPLGVGNGGLDWKDVEPRLRDAFSDMPDVTVHIYAPSSAHREVDAPIKLRMTWGRAMLLDLLRRYVQQRQAMEPWEDPSGASHLEIQKLMYFANVLEPRLTLDFEPGRYGPYSEKVRHLVQNMEGAYLKGFGDGSDRVLEQTPIALTNLAASELDRYLSERDSSKERTIVDTVLAFIKGFEGPYGLELLASTHWVAVEEQAWEPREAAQAVRSWTKRKGRIYTDRRVSCALERLQSPVGRELISA